MKVPLKTDKCTRIQLNSDETCQFMMDKFMILPLDDYLL